MSSGAKRPPAEVSVFASAGASPCKPKRRKQSTPVRISGEPGPDPLLPPPSPSSPSDPHRSADAPESPANFHIADDCVDSYGHRVARYSDTIKAGGQIPGGHRQHNSRDSGYFQKYREQLTDDESKCGAGGLTITRTNDVDRGEEADRRGSHAIESAAERRHGDMENSIAFRPGSAPGERPREAERYGREDGDHSEGLLSGSNSELPRGSPDALDGYGGLDSDERQTCGRCGGIFPSAESLRAHFESEHSERNGRGPQLQGLECKIEPYDADDGSPRAGSGPTPAPVPDPRMDAWSVDFQNKMADIYKNALTFPHDMPKESIPPNFNPLCPPFPLFSTAVPPQRPIMEPIRIFNPEAYCELCSKEFCNKYFLKTHKANKHGIYESAPSSSGADGLGLESSIMPAALASSALKFKSNMMLAEYAKSYEAALLASQRHKAKIQRMMEEARDADRANVDGQQAGPGASMSARQLHLDEVRSSSDDNTIPENFIFKGDARQEHEEAFTTPTPRKLSPDSSKRARDSGFSADTLRRLGVINPEAFCKICCKEYCNKYFLKTHKIKRHGLPPSPTERCGGREPATHAPEATERKEGQTSPLNLIMGEESPGKRERSPDSAPPAQPRGAGVAQSVGARPLSTHSVDSTGVEERRDVQGEEAIKGDGSKQSPTTVFISEDLQKLQTMISQLNDLSVNKIVECYVCKKEFENNYILQFHMMSDHGISVTGSADAFAFPVGGDEIAPEAIQSQKTACTICEKDFPTALLLKKHIEDFHSQKLNYGDPKTPVDCLTSEREASAQRERRASMSLTPTNSYCEICNKELCNKYFMKTHMQRMHGIEIENGTQIGGVICDICNKELCSKYFLRVHKHNTHGIVEPGAPLPQMRNLTGEQEAFNAPQAASPLKPPPEASILSNRFIAHFVEVCPFCSRRFRTSKWLKAHLLSDHGKAGVDKWKELEVQYKAQARVQSAKSGKQAGGALSVPDGNSNAASSQNSPMDAQDRIPFYSKLSEPKILNLFGMNNPEIKTYNCSYCPFSTSILSFLYVHEKSHAQGPEMDVLCPMCPESFGKPEALQIHIITAHSLPEWRDRPGLSASPSSNRECQSRQAKTPPPEMDEDKSRIRTSNGNGTGKRELFDCYECDFKSCNFEEMESHLKSQHCAVKEGSFDALPEMDGDEARRKSRMPAIYAVPRDGGADGGERASITMQPFVIEENTSEAGGGKFVPSVVFLPVRRRATGAVTISFNLTPA